MTRIGIPRALSFLQHYPQWRTFLEELGADVVISPPTNRDIMASGARVVADVTCLPVKVYAGHVIWLRDHGRVDFVFVPAIWNVEQDAFHCAKFKALPDIMKACVPDCPPLLDIEINPQLRKITRLRAFRRLGFQLTRNPFKIERAWRRAREAEAAYQSLLVGEQLTYPEALARLYPDEWTISSQPTAASPCLTIAVSGHPYCLYDDYITHNLIARLRDMGAKVVTSEMVGVKDAQEGIQRTTKGTRWFYENWMSGAAGYYLYRPDVDGLISVLAFACGPDSTMVETITRRAHALKRSAMSLVLDEHGSATGMATRLEAFVDMLTRQKQQRAAQRKRTEVPKPAARALPASPPAVLREARKPVLGFPRMGTTYIPIKSLFQGVGACVELGPSLSNRTISIGARHSPEFICTPYKYILGNMIEMLEAGADTLLYVGGIDLCRSGTFAQLMTDALNDLGYKFSFLTTVLIDEGVLGIAKFLRRFSPEVTWRVVLREIRLALAKMFALDELERQVQHIRPREITPGGVDKVWDEAQMRIDEAREADLLPVIKRDVLQKMDRVPINSAARPVQVMTAGEYYAVLEPFFNLDLERELGRLGAEVHRSLMMSHWARGTLILEALGFPRKPEIDRAARPYLRWNVSGEAWDTIGQSVLYAQKGVDGVVETLPLTCVPEIAALNILPRVSRDWNLPIMTFIFDELSGRAGLRTRLEAFVDLLFRRREMKENPPQTVTAKTPPQECAACPLASNCSLPFTGNCAYATNRPSQNANPSVETPRRDVSTGRSEIASEQRGKI